MGEMKTRLGSARQALRGYPVKIFLICVFGLALSNTDQSLFGYAIPGLLAEFDVGLDAVGWILSISFVVAALCNVAIGVAADRLGRRRLFIGCLAISAVLVAALTFAPDIYSLTALRAIAFGVSAALVPLASTYTVEAAPDRFRGVLTGLLQVGYPIGWFVASLIAAPILSISSWRYIFLPALVVAPLAFLFARWLPESARFVESQKKQPDDGGTPFAQLAILAEPALRRRTILCVLMFFFHAMGYAGTAFYFPTYFHEVYGYSEQEAASLVGMSYGIGIIGYLGGALVGEFWLTRRDTIVVWVSIGALAFLGLIWLPETKAENVFWFALMTVFFYGSAAVQWAFAAEQFPTRTRATATSVVMAAVLIGFAIAPVIVAYIVEQLDWRWSFTVTVFPSLVLSVLATLGLESIKSGVALDEIAEVT